MNKMNQNPQKKQSLQYQNNLKASQSKKQSNNVFESNNSRPKPILKTFKHYYSWKKKQSKQIKFQQLKSEEKEPIFSIALHYGTINGRNQVLQEYGSTSGSGNKGKLKNKNMNSFQKILSTHKNSRAWSDPKRLSFFDFKIKRNLKESFSFSKTKSIELNSQKQRKKSKTQPKSYTVGFRGSSFPKQLTELKQQINQLPSVKQFCKKSLTIVPATSYIEQMNFGSLLPIQDDFNKSLLQSHIKSCQQSPKFEKRKFRQSKYQSFNDYIQQLNEVMIYADQLLQEEAQLNDQLQIKKKIGYIETSNHHQICQIKRKINNYRRYWPQYNRYSINVTKSDQDQDVAKSFTNFSYSDTQLNESLQKLVNIIKIDLNYQEKQLNKEIVHSQKNAIQDRYNYKMSIEKDNYKRNIKSLLKCKKQYRIQRRREEVRANGIIRIKKANRSQNKFQVQLKEQEQC